MHQLQPITATKCIQFVAAFLASRYNTHSQEGGSAVGQALPPKGDSPWAARWEETYEDLKNPASPPQADERDFFAQKNTPQPFGWGADACSKVAKPPSYEQALRLLHPRLIRVVYHRTLYAQTSEGIVYSRTSLNHNLREVFHRPNIGLL